MRKTTRNDILLANGQAAHGTASEEDLRGMNRKMRRALEAVNRHKPGSGKLMEIHTSGVFKLRKI